MIRILNLPRKVHDNATDTTQSKHVTDNKDEFLLVLLKPSANSLRLVICVFVMPALVGVLLGFGSVATATISTLVIIGALKGLTLLVPSWNYLKRDHETLILRQGPAADLVLSTKQLLEPQTWFYYIPPFAPLIRAKLVWTDEAGRRKTKAIFHVFGRNLEETMIAISPSKDCGNQK